MGELLFEMEAYGKPVSVNSAYPVSGKESVASGNRWKYLSKDGRKWKEDVKKAMPIMRDETIDFPVIIEYHFTFKDYINRDVANYEKLTTDCLVEEDIILDDNIKIVKKLILSADVDKSLKEAKCSIKIYKY